MDLFRSKIDTLQQMIAQADERLDIVAERIADKYEIKLDEYDLDMLTGRFVRKPNIIFRKSVQDFESEVVDEEEETE
jgi:hypothetical protein